MKNKVQQTSSVSEIDPQVGADFRGLKTNRELDSEISEGTSRSVVSMPELSAGLPPHLQKFVGRGDYEIIDVTPKGYGPGE